MTSNQHSVASLLSDARTILAESTDSPRLDAELLLAHCLKKNRTTLFTWPDASVADDIAENFLALIAERKKEVPIAYLTGSKEFWSLDFHVTKDTLIPRPDTELLVQLAVDALTDTPGPVLDLGTGSGAIAICIAKEHPSIRVDAVDNSAKALSVASHNAKKHGEQVNFLVSDWYQNVSASDYQIIVSNPPYIDAEDDHLQRGGLQHEPIAALRAAKNGMAAIKHIIEHASAHCRHDGQVMIEHGNDQGETTRRLMHKQGFTNVHTHQDIEDRDRVTIGKVSQLFRQCKSPESQKIC